MACGHGVDPADPKTDLNVIKYEQAPSAAPSAAPAEPSPDEIQLSTAYIPFADRDAMNDVIDQERRKNHKLQEKLDKVCKNYYDLELVNDDLRASVREWREKRNGTLWGGLLVMFTFIFISGLGFYALVCENNNLRKELDRPPLHGIVPASHQPKPMPLKKADIPHGFH